MSKLQAGGQGTPCRSYRSLFQEDGCGYKHGAPSGAVPKPALAIPPNPYGMMSIKMQDPDNARPASGAGGGLAFCQVEDAGDDAVGHRLEPERLHRVSRAAFGQRPNRRRITEHLGQRHFGADNRRGVLGFDMDDLAPAPVHPRSAEYARRAKANSYQ